MGLLAQRCAQVHEESDSRFGSRLRSLLELVDSFDESSSGTISIICLLSASITNSQPLPHYLNICDTGRLSHNTESRLNAREEERIMGEPKPALLVVLRKSTNILTENVEKLVL
jgi:hypothetical protein